MTFSFPLPIPNPDELSADQIRLLLKYRHEANNAMGHALNTIIEPLSKLIMQPFADAAAAERRGETVNMTDEEIEQVFAGTRALGRIRCAMKRSMEINAASCINLLAHLAYSK